MKKYNPNSIEQAIYSIWEGKNFFNPDSYPGKGKNYSIVIPPPNVTGCLHIGHALVNSLQDILIRRKRMQGYRCLWLPGTDHAGIATQMVVERDLLTKGIVRKEIGKTEFVKKIWEWKEKHGNQIYQQLKRLGASLDWSRERFTLDDGLSAAVKKSFVKLYKEGLIYRGEYMVNWCPKDQTALSDLEVDHIQIESEITTIRYPLVDGGFIEVATTRPETMLGDTAVAVHPEDLRYKNLINKKVLVPLIEREITVIADESCDPEFGTGAVKITPAHDPNDFFIGKKHGLEFINIFEKDATINDIYPALQGVERFKARQLIIAELKQKKLWVSTEKHLANVGHSQRSKTIIEPRISTQWFCKMDKMAEVALEKLNQGSIKFVPQAQEKIFREWLTNIKDWCISRQLWWGHSIPAYHCQDCTKITVAEAQPSCCEHCQSKNLVADPDVLDTWYSSGLFPFSTMGWPKTDKADYQNFYPNSVLVTGYDILFFWVARMIMLGLKLTKKLPFPAVFTHGLVRDEKGEKMSKTKGNVIDPLNIIEKHGADALRFSLCSLTVGSKDLKLPEQNIIQSKHFINKVWNAVNFSFYHFEQNKIVESIEQPAEIDLFTKWILKRSHQVLEQYNEYLDRYRFFEVASLIYKFIWGEVCDWYLEIIKPMLFDKIDNKSKRSALFGLQQVLEISLKLLHPICPFVTEKLWQELPTTRGYLITQQFSELNSSWQQVATNDAQEIIDLVNRIRTVKGENNISPKQKIDLFLVCSKISLNKKIQEIEPVLIALAGIDNLYYQNKIIQKKGFATSEGLIFSFAIDLTKGLDLVGEQKRLQAELNKIIKRKEHLNSQLKNELFRQKAPAKLVAKNEKEVEQLKQQQDKLQLQLKELLQN